MKELINCIAKALVDKEHKNFRIKSEDTLTFTVQISSGSIWALKFGQ